MEHPGATAWGQAALAAGLFVPLCLALVRGAARLGLVDVPSGRRTHRAPAARVGGLAVLGALYLAEWIDRGTAPGGAAWAATLAMAALGLADDVLRDRFRWELKLIIQLTVAGCFASTQGSWWLAPALVAAMNIYNFFDHGNGLFALGLIPAAFLAVHGDGAYATGALLAFLVPNLRGAVFAGDAGSHALAFLIFSRLGSAGSGSTLAATVLAAALPLADFIYVIIARLRRGTRPWHSTPDHLGNRFDRLGIPRGRALGAVAVVQAVASWAALLVADASLAVIVRGVIVFGFVMCLAMFIAKTLGSEGRRSS
jgi:UDP-GlcNAc:undecaprenyl-phosphate GlcNAc-1-phosphate transferase